MSTVSVIIPTYNGADMVADAVMSAYRQTVSPHEVIVINDGSTDETARLLRRLQEELPSSLRVIEQSNLGDGAARNAGIRTATGEYIAFLDHDDTWHPTKTARQLEQFASEADLSASFTAYRLVGHVTGDKIEAGEWDPDPKSVLEKLVQANMLVTSSAVMVRREALAHVPGFDESPGSFGCDWLMWLNMAQAGLRIGHIPEPLTDYRWHGANKSGSVSGGYETACHVFDQFFTSERNQIRYDGRLRDGKWFRARRHLLAAINAIQEGDRPRARRHILTAARLSPRSIRPGWIRMLGLGPRPA